MTHIQTHEAISKDHHPAQKHKFKSKAVTPTEGQDAIPIIKTEGRLKDTQALRSTYAFDIHAEAKLKTIRELWHSHNECEDKVSSGPQRMTKAKRVLEVGLLTLFILALSTRMYSFWSKGFNYDPVQQPATIMAGESLAPHQYRILYPVLWKGLSLAMSEEKADHLLLFITIVFSYSVLFFVFTHQTRNTILSCVCLLAFHGACSHPYQFQFRDTFFEIAFVMLAFSMQTRIVSRKINWNAFAALTALGTLNRETWIFVLCGMAVSACAAAGGPIQLMKSTDWRDAKLGLVKAGLVFALVAVGSRLVFGLKPYYCRFWTLNENIMHIFFWRNWAFTFGHGFWGAGAGLFILFLITLFAGNRFHLPFILGYFIPLLVISFFIVARLMESRTFFPVFAVLLCSIACFVQQEIARDSSGKT